MTPQLQPAGPPVDHPALAGLEFSTGDLISILAIIAIAGLLVAFYVAMFVGVLVSSVQHLHRAGQIRHPYLLGLIPLVALLFAYEAGSVAGALLATGGLAFGYALMFYAGRSWFRWTAVPVLAFLLHSVVTAR